MLIGKLGTPEFLTVSSICYCETIPKKFKCLNTPHLITTDPTFLEKDYPTLYNLCKHGAKFRVQTERINPKDIKSAINTFAATLEKKYASNDQELYG